MTLTRIKRAVGYVLGFYEAAQWRQKRGYSNHSSSQDAWLDISKAALETIRDKSRHLEANDWLANKLAGVFCQYVVGTNGLQVTPASSDQAFNDLASKEWRDSAALIDIETQTGFGDLQWRTSWRRFFDGDCFWLKVRGSSGRARLQLIEGHRVKTPPNKQDGPQLSNGVETDEFGRPTFYWIASGPDAKDFKRVDAALVIPIVDRSRSRQVRGLPHLTPVLNQINDLRTLFGLEIDKAHEHASRALAIETETGEAPDMEELIRTGTTITNGDAISGQDSETRVKNIREATGSSVFYMKVGEKINSIGSNSPSAATQWLWDYSIGMVCAGAQISKLLVMPWSINGTVTRADLDAQAQIFRAQSAIEARAAQLAYEFVIGDAVAQGRIRGVKVPADYLRSNVRSPRGVNVDIGRNSNAMLAELKAGARTFQSVYSELGLDWMDELSQKAKEIEFIHKLAQDSGVSPSLISDVVIEDITKQTDPAQPETSPFEQIKVELDAYGVAVRAGAISPTVEDEAFFREKQGLPELSKAAKEAWNKETTSGVRRPITLTPLIGDSPQTTALDESLTPEETLA